MAKQQSKNSTTNIIIIASICIIIIVVAIILIVGATSNRVTRTLKEQTEANIKFDNKKLMYIYFMEMDVLIVNN